MQSMYTYYMQLLQKMLLFFFLMAVVTNDTCWSNLSETEIPIPMAFLDTQFSSLTARFVKLALLFSKRPHNPH